MLLMWTTALEPKRRPSTMSRPGSAVAYSRADQLPPVVYTGSPAPEQGMSALSHPEAMERFTVCLLTADACFILTRM